MRRRLLALVAVLALAGLPLVPACVHPPTSQLSPAGQTAYTADQIVTRITELERAVIEADATGGMARADARVVIQFCVDAHKVLAATPSGWRQTLQQSWVVAKPHLPLTTPAFAGIAAALDVLLGSL